MGLDKNGTELILGTSEIQEKAFNFWTSNGFKLINTDISIIVLNYIL